MFEVGGDSENSREMEPWPCARHGAGPSRLKRRLMPNSPTPKGFELMEARSRW